MYRKFLVIFGLSTVILIGGVVAFNCLVDPYNVWSSYRREGFNQWTPRAENLDRLIQPIRFIKEKPETVFLGNSQVMWGIEASEYTRITGKSAYNLAMLGSSIYEIRRTLEHAIAVDENLREVFVCLNFELFAANERHPIPKQILQFDESQLGSSFIVPSNFVKTTLSFKALEDSIETVKANEKNKYSFAYYMPTGRWHDKSILSYCQNRQWTFNASMKIMARNDYYYEDLSIDAGALEDMWRIVALCQENDIDLHVYTIPMHARSMENYAYVWETYEDWVRGLVKITPITNFIDYNQYTTSESADGLLDENTNPYFWDSHHANTVLCNKVLAELSGEKKLTLGKVLNEENVEQHLELLTKKRIAWEKMHPESVEEVRYYTGFSPAVPLLLQRKAAPVGKSVVRLDLESGMERPRVSLKQEGKLDLSGEHLTPIGKTKVMYATLENNEKKYYTFAEPIIKPEIANFMHDKTYEANGFHILEPLRKVDKGEYELYLIEVAENGMVYKSDSIASIKIN